MEGSTGGDDTKAEGGMTLGSTVFEIRVGDPPYREAGRRPLFEEIFKGIGAVVAAEQLWWMEQRDERESLRILFFDAAVSKVMVNLGLTRPEAEQRVHEILRSTPYGIEELYDWLVTLGNVEKWTMDTDTVSRVANNIDEKRVWEEVDRRDRPRHVPGDRTTPARRKKSRRFERERRANVRRSRK